MADLETQIRRYGAAVMDRVAPVEAPEAHFLPTTRPSGRQRRAVVVVAVAVVLIGSTVGVWTQLRSEHDDPTVVAGPQAGEVPDLQTDLVVREVDVFEEGECYDRGFDVPVPCSGSHETEQFASFRTRGIPDVIDKESRVDVCHQLFGVYAGIEYAEQSQYLVGYVTDTSEHPEESITCHLTSASGGQLPPESVRRS